MSLLEIFIIVFAFFAISRVLLRFRDKKVSIAETFFWLCLWLGLITLALIPDLLTIFTKSVGISRPVDFAVYLSLVLLFYLLFRLYVKSETLEQDLTKVVREIAIKRKK